MALALMLDTCFLIDLQRERTKGIEHGPCVAFLREHRSSRLLLSAIAAGEFAEGFAPGHEAQLQHWLDHFDLRPVGQRTSAIYGRLARRLRADGRLPGSNDLWIAAGAIEHETALVTRDRGGFAHLPELEVIAYAAA